MEEGFCHAGELRGVVHVDEEDPASGTVHVREVRRLGLDLFHNGLHGLRESSLLDECVGYLRGHAETEHETHTLSLSPPFSRSLKVGSLTLPARAMLDLNAARTLRSSVPPAN